MWLGALWLALALSVAVNAELAADAWRIGRFAVGAPVLAALFAFVHFRSNDA